MNVESGGAIRADLLHAMGKLRDQQDPITAVTKLGDPDPVVRRWAVWTTGDLTNYLMPFIYHGLDSPVSFKPEDRSKAHAEWARGQVDRAL